MRVRHAIILIFMIVTIIILGSLVVIDIFFSKPEFKITVEECNYGDTIDGGFNINNYYASVVLNLTKYNLHVLINGEENITCDEHICEVSRNINPITCAFVEIGIKIFVYDNGSIQGIVPYKTKKGSKTNSINVIDSYDLTVEWLDENCEIIDFFGTPLENGSSIYGDCNKDDPFCRWVCIDYSTDEYYNIEVTQ